MCFGGSVVDQFYEDSVGALVKQQKGLDVFKFRSGGRAAILAHKTRHPFQAVFIHSLFSFSSSKDCKPHFKTLGEHKLFNYISMLILQNYGFVCSGRRTGFYSPALPICTKTLQETRSSLKGGDEDAKAPLCPNHRRDNVYPDTLTD